MAGLEPCGLAAPFFQRAVREDAAAEVRKAGLACLQLRPRFSAEATGKPNLAGDRTSFTYAGVLAGLPESSAPDLKNKSFSVSAKVKVEENANGMIFTQGGNTGGWAFYLKDGKLKAAHNYLDVALYSVEATAPCPPESMS
ncbi:MAG: hypothetical protein AB7S74_13990 [Hyphomicrobium sp.]